MIAAREFTLKKALSQVDVNTDCRKDFSKISKTFTKLLVSPEIALSTVYPAGPRERRYGACCRRLIA
jgi:hypothetical protein